MWKVLHTLQNTLKFALVKKKKTIFQTLLQGINSLDNRTAAVIIQTVLCLSQDAYSLYAHPEYLTNFKFQLWEFLTLQHKKTF